MNTHHKLISAAKRAAKALSRTEGLSYQKSLDIVAQKCGRSTWSAFLADPVPVDTDAETAAGEPDFTRIPADLHFETAVRYGVGRGAGTMQARHRNWDDPRPVLIYDTDKGEWPIDARGLDIGALMASCLHPVPPVMQQGWAGNQWTAMPRVGGILMRAKARMDVNAGHSTSTVSVGLDGREPVMPSELKPPVHDLATYEIHATPTPPKHRLRDRIRRSIQPGYDLEGFMRTGLLDKERGPVIGEVPGFGRGGLESGRIRLRPGHGLMCFSTAGTGRMAGLSITALLTDASSSYVVHDEGIHLEVTSGWRASIGRVAVIRIDEPTIDSINPFDRHWLPERRDVQAIHVDAIMQAMLPDDAPMARLLTEAAMRRIERYGQTTLYEVHAELETMEDHPLKEAGLLFLDPLVTRHIRPVTDTSTIVPEDLRGRMLDGNRPLTLYMVRDGRASSPRAPLLAALQSAIWNWTLSWGPREEIGHGRVNGPLPVTTLLTDMHRMPVLRDLPKVLDTGRSKESGVIISSAQGSTITHRYGAKRAQIIREACHVRLAITQSDPGDMPYVDPEERIGYSTLAQVGQKESYLLANGNEPARMKRPFFYADQEIIRRAFNVRTGLGPKPVA